MAKQLKKRRYLSRSYSKSRFAWKHLALKAILLLILTLAVALGLWALYLDYQVKVKFEGKKWAIPARVYAQPLELYQGLQITEQELENELKALGYQSTQHLSRPGEVLQVQLHSNWDAIKVCS